tara:strand:- start:43 stop:261 length:219 start_codon:yes stop_codon:yes gene_type:complete
MPTKNARPKSKPEAPPRSSVNSETGATRGFEEIKIYSVDEETGATRGPDIEMVPVKKASGGRLGYRSARQPK